MPRFIERIRRAISRAQGTAVAAPHTAPMIACMFLMKRGSGVSLMPTIVMVANCGFGSDLSVAFTPLKILICRGAGIEGELYCEVRACGMVCGILVKEKE